MPLTPSQEINARKLFSMIKDAFERDHKRKCDAFDAMVKNFVESHPRDSKEAVNVIKRLKPILGNEVMHEVLWDIRAELHHRAQASSSASSSTHSTSGSSASSSTASSNVTEAGDVVCTGERTVEQRNEEGFANAIVLDEDDELQFLTVRVLKPKGM